MDMLSLHDVMTGLSAALAPTILLWSLVGVVVGMIFGAAPGLTATAGVAIATPLTFGVGFEQSMGLLLGIYCGGYFAGSIPAILVNTPGAPGNAATTMDGYPMSRMGKADLALALAILSSFVGGIFSGLVLMVLAPALSGVALKFTAVEYAGFGIFGLVCVASISGGSILRGCVAATIGMLLGTVGIDPEDGVMRMTFGLPGLITGVPLIPALIAFFAVTEMLNQGNLTGTTVLPAQKRARLGEVLTIYLRHKLLLLKSALIGTGIGILPGTGPTVASWISYSEASREAKHPDEPPLGQGAPAGIIASEVANNAVTGGAMVPLLTLGIPGDTVTAVMLGALAIQNVTPGPFFILERGDLFASIIWILLLSNVWLLFIGLVARPFLPGILKIPPRVLVPLIGVLAATGCFADGNTAFAVALMGLLGIGGYLLGALGLPMPPLVLGLVLGPIIEKNLRDALVVHHMDLTVFITRPISAVIMAVTLLTLILAVRGARRKV